jgi:hypothetical protein
MALGVIGDMYQQTTDVGRQRFLSDRTLLT